MTFVSEGLSSFSRDETDVLESLICAPLSYTDPGHGWD